MHESRLGRVERYIRPFGTFWQRFRLGRYGPYIGTRDNVDVSTFASSGKDDTDPRDLSGAYAAIRAYAAKLYGGGVVFNAGATGAGADWSLTFTRPSTGMTENVTVVWPSNTPSNGDVLTVLSYAPGLIELEWAAGGGGGGGQASIQFQDEGSNLGAAGAVDTLDFTGAGVTATRVGNVVTVNVPNNGFFLDARYGAYEFDDFLVGVPNAISAYGPVTFAESWTGGGFDTTAYDSADIGHPGVMRARVSNTNGGLVRTFGCALNPSTNSGGRLHLGYGTFEVTWWFYLDQLSTPSSPFSHNVGVADTGQYAAQSNALLCLYSHTINSGVVTLRCSAGGVNVDTAGSTTLAAGTWYRARIVCNAARNLVQLYLKAGAGAEALEATYSGSNVPAASVNLGTTSTLYRSGSAPGASYCRWDRWQVIYTLTNER